MKAFLTRTRFHVADYGALIVSLAILVIVVMHEHAGRWEGRLFPVVVDADITSVLSADEFQTDINGETTKIRDCKWIETKIWAGQPGSSMLLTVARPAGLEDFGLGRHKWSTMRVPLPIALTTNNTAITLHRCHNFWLTETRLFGPETPRP